MNSSFLKKNWYYLTPAALVVIPVLIMLYISMAYGYSMGESFEAMKHVGSTGTRYAMKFSETNFNKVVPGMDPKTVHSYISTPMERNIPEDTRWRYSLPASGASYYHDRTIVFAPDKNGVMRVKETISSFKKL